MPPPNTGLGRPWQRFEIRKYRGEPPVLIDSTPAQDHVEKLVGWGLTHGAIAAAAGTSRYAIGRHAARIPKTIPRNYAAAILAVDHLPHPDQRMVLTVGSRRRVQAMVALGWTMGYLAKRVGLHDASTLRVMIIKSTMMRADRWRIIRDLYLEHADRPGPSDSARELAARHGWPSSWAWDLETIDHPDTEPHTYERHAEAEVKLGVDAEWLMSPDGGSLSVEAVAAKFDVQIDSVKRALQRHRLRRSRADARKVTDDQVAEMRHRHHVDGVPQNVLALEYGISKGHASALINATPRARVTPHPDDVEPEERSA